MQINNKKGHAILGVWYVGHVGSALIVPAAFKLAFAAIALAAIWHIPAWEQAKANHTEAAYQAQQMWPQQLFAKLPNGNYAYVDPKVVTPSGGHLRASLLAMQKPERIWSHI